MQIVIKETLMYEKVGLCFSDLGPKINYTADSRFIKRVCGMTKNSILVNLKKKKLLHLLKD